MHQLQKLFVCKRAEARFKTLECSGGAPGRPVLFQVGGGQSGVGAQQPTSVVEEHQELGQGFGGRRVRRLPTGEEAEVRRTQGAQVPGHAH